MRWSAQDIADIVHGTLHADPETVVTSITTDSRQVSPGALFVAIVGERFDGADFATLAIEAGASLVLAQRAVAAPCVVVPDVEVAFGALAQAHLQTLPHTEVVAITGSSGKTSTKDLLAQVLAEAGPTVAAPGSFNNEIGLPRTVLEADEDTRFLVLEMGMRGEGQIARLCRIAPPDVAVVLNVGSAHIGITGSRDVTARCKGEILQGLHSDGTAIINRDDAYAPYFRQLASCPTVEFGLQDGFIHASALVLDADARASFTLHIGDAQEPVRLQLLGEHHVANALATAAMAHACGLGIAQIAAALSGATARSHGRMEAFELPNGVTVINDAYNANPESMSSALRALAAMGRNRRTWAVLGEMRELGDIAMQEHDAIGRLAVRLDISHTVGVGTAGKWIQMGAANEGSWGDEAAHVADPESAAAYVIERWRPGDIVLIKASNAVRLDRVAEALRVAAARED